METGRQDGGSDKNHAPFSVGKTGNISRKFLTIILKIFDKNFERLQLVNPIFTQDGEQVKVSVSVKYLDQRTKATQISQFDLTLEKDSNWKIVK